MGFNFTRGGPPTFKNDRKKESDVNRKAIELENNSKDLRKVINQETRKEHREGGERRRGGGGNYKQRGGYEQKPQRQVFDDPDYGIETDEFVQVENRDRGVQKQYQQKRGGQYDREERKQDN